MTDFAKPTTPADALRQRAEMVEYQIRAHEQKIREHQVVIEALRHEWGELLSDADRYERYQPKTVQGWEELIDGTPVHADSYRRGVHDGQRGPQTVDEPEVDASHNQQDNA